MPKSRKKDSETFSEEEALERMNKALKKAMEKKPETHEQMIGKRRAKSPRKPTT